MRLKIFLENKNEIAKHNLLYARGLTTFNMDPYGFRYKESSGLLKSRPNEAFYATGEGISEAKDWGRMGVVTEVKKQLECGSCWAFSATGALEAQYARKTRRLVSLSEQNLVDCSTNNYACKHGSPASAFVDIARYHGIDTEASYPYEGVQRRCRFNPSTVASELLIVAMWPFNKTRER